MTIAVQNSDHKSSIGRSSKWTSKNLEASSAYRIIYRYNWFGFKKKNMDHSPLQQQFLWCKINDIHTCGPYQIRPSDILSRSKSETSSNQAGGLTNNQAKVLVRIIQSLHPGQKRYKKVDRANSWHRVVDVFFTLNWVNVMVNHQSPRFHFLKSSRDLQDLFFLEGVHTFYISLQRSHFLNVSVNFWKSCSF